MNVGNKAVCHEVQMHFLSYPSPTFTKMFWAHFCAQKRSCLPWSPRAFWRCSLCKLKKSSGRICRFLRPKTKVFSSNFRRNLEVLVLQVLQKKFWVQFHELCVQKRSCLLWSSDAFWKFLPCKLCKKSSGRIFSIYASKNKLFTVEFRCILEVFAFQAL